MPELAQETKVCRSCWEPRPITDFRRRKKGGDERMHQCRKCRNEDERLRQNAARSRGRDRNIRAQITALKRARNDLEFRALLNMMLARYGGVPGFARAWYEHLSHAEVDAPGSKRVLDSFSAILRLTEYCQDRRPKVEEMSDEELEASLHRHIRCLIEERPELVIAAAQKLGQP